MGNLVMSVISMILALGGIVATSVGINSQLDKEDDPVIEEGVFTTTELSSKCKLLFHPVVSTLHPNMFKFEMYKLL